MRNFPAWLMACALFIAGENAIAQTSDVIKAAINENGLVGNLFVPANAKGRLPAILVLGGSEGGLNEAVVVQSRLIAEKGYVTLQLGYFDLPGLPKTLESLPLEYFKAALDWLRAQPNVDKSRIGVVGTSKGGEAALLIASHYSEIKVVVAGVPSNVVWPAIKATHGGSSWTLDGKDLPMLPYGMEGGFTSVFALYEKGLKKFDDYPNAVIQVEKIAGPVLLACGRDDGPSCPMSERAIARLKEKHFKYKFELLAYPDAGHASFGPPLPADSERLKGLASLGGTPEGNNAARADDWSKALAFLDAALKS